MSEVATPTGNSVAERTIRTIKRQLLACEGPKRVKSMREIALVLDQRVAFYNNEFRPKRACGVTPAKLRPALTAAQHFAPPKILTYSNHDANHKAIIQFKQQDFSDHPYHMLQTTRDSVQRIEQKNLQIAQDAESQIGHHRTKD